MVGKASRYASVLSRADGGINGRDSAAVLPRNLSFFCAQLIGCACACGCGELDRSHAESVFGHILVAFRNGLPHFLIGVIVFNDDLLDGIGGFFKKPCDFHVTLSERAEGDFAIQDSVFIGLFVGVLTERTVLEVEKDHAVAEFLDHFHGAFGTEVIGPVGIEFEFDAGNHPKVDIVFQFAADAIEFECVVVLEESNTGLRKDFEHGIRVVGGSFDGIQIRKIVRTVTADAVCQAKIAEFVDDFLAIGGRVSPRGVCRNHFKTEIVEDGAEFFRGDIVQSGRFHDFVADFRHAFDGFDKILARFRVFAQGVELDSNRTFHVQEIGLGLIF